MRKKNEGKPTRNAEDKLKDLDFIVPLFLKGMRFGEIAETLQAEREYKVDYKVVYRDIGHLLKIWKEERAKLIPAALEIQLRKLERMEAVCWEQFEKSKQAKTKDIDKQRAIFDKKTKKQVGDMVFREGQKHTTVSIGDGSWLDKIFKCWEMQADLLQLKNVPPPANDDVAPIGELVFLTVSRKQRKEYTEAIEVPEEDGNNIQKLIQS